MRALGITLATVLMLAGCNAAAPPTAPPASPASIVPTAVPATAVPPTATPAPIVTAAPTATSQLPDLGGEVPDKLLVDILDQVAAATGLAMADIVVQRAEAVTWSDGSLGCPEPGMMYTQALVDGFWVVIEAGGDTYDFHASQSGQIVLCPEGRSNPPIEP
jgi:hypothetical protein